MIDRENVMRGLEVCSDPNITCMECPYYANQSECSGILFHDVLDLLREQEPRVLEYSEIEKHPLVWLEDNDKEDVIPALFLQYNGWSAEFALQAPDEYVDTIIRSPIVSAVEGMYGVTWRAWMTKPTDEQRKAVPWDD